MPALLADAPAGVGAAIGVGEAYAAYREGDYRKAGDKLSGASGSLVGGAAAEIGVAAFIGAEGTSALLIEGTALAIGSTIALPLLVGGLVGVGAILVYRHYSGYRPPVSGHE